jgi:hypothetical protein
MAQLKMLRSMLLPRLCWIFVDLLHVLHVWWTARWHVDSVWVRQSAAVVLVITFVIAFRRLRACMHRVVHL